MKRTISLLSIVTTLIVCPCPAQFNYSDLAFLANGNKAASDPLPAGIGFRWQYESLPDGVVSNWVDSVQGYSWVQGTDASRPSKGANGVTFTTGKFLIASNLLRCDSTSGGMKDCFLMIVSFDDASVEQVIVMDTAGGQEFAGVSGALKWYNPNVPFGAPVNSQWVDWLYAGTNFGTTKFRTYTNGVVGLDDVSGSIFSATVTRIGRSTPGAYFKGKMKEFIVWTNVVGFTTTQVSNIHYYATNRYSFTP